ncbi:hypothetical protein ACFY2K_11785 [Kitasatospora sp. NPDC001309]|uniref:hypothetical protein n=1 Tax=Kitasatospora sp. NPDC001309 TaxID=3364013 RepID=UPI0036785FE4
MNEYTAERFDPANWAAAFAQLVGAEGVKVEVGSVQGDLIEITYRIGLRDKWAAASLLIRSLEMGATVRAQRTYERPAHGEGLELVAQYPVTLFRRPPLNRVVGDSRYLLAGMFDEMDETKGEGFE